MITSTSNISTIEAWQAFLVGPLYALRSKVDFGYLQIHEILSQNSNYSQLEDRLNYNFKNRDLLINALLHKSFVNETKNLKIQSNERLEFLGDALLGAITTSLIVEKYPKLTEGDLSLLRSALVNEDSWSLLGKFLKLDYCIVVSRGEQLASGYLKDSILANVLEALFGAIFLDSSYDKAQEVFCTLINHYDQINKSSFLSMNKMGVTNVKGKLQEILLSDYMTLPEYRFSLLSNNLYQADLYVGDRLVATATDVSKKKAAKLVAGIALAKINSQSEIFLC